MCPKNETEREVWKNIALLFFASVLVLIMQIIQGEAMLFFIMIIVLLFFEVVTANGYKQKIHRSEVYRFLKANLKRHRELSL